ncbi:MAG TPA: hypothetical protein DHV83_01100, partial [Prevotella sp.]|nr:hypothetical protein [Prevotella sp.]
NEYIFSIFVNILNTIEDGELEEKRGVEGETIVCACPFRSLQRCERIAFLFRKKSFFMFVFSDFMLTFASLK